MLQRNGHKVRNGMIWPFNRRVERKENPVGAALILPGGEAWAPRKGRAFVAEGYQQNVIVYRAIREIVLAQADLEIEVASGEDVLDAHPALTLLERPNPTQGWDAFLSEIFTNFETLGEMAIARYPADGMPAELWSINPLNVKVIPGAGGMAARYEYDQNGRKIEFPVDRLTGRSQLFFYKTYNPADYWRGQSPLVAAGLAADTHNAGLMWNYRLLKNSARPSGLVKMAEGAGGEVVERMREWFKRAFQGEGNAGEIPVLPAGAEWVPMDNNPRDMDFLNTQKECAKLICAAFGVPLPLIDNDASTFNNMEQAKERFYTDTILPKFNGFLASFGNWLLPLYGEGLRFQVDIDAIGALEAMRTRKFERLLKAVAEGCLTVDEFREAVGYAPVGGSAAVLDPVGQAVQAAIAQDEAGVKRAARLAYG
jgi:HK97 family phage portal protein